MTRSVVLSLVLLACGIDCDAAKKVKGKVELGRAALELLYVGNPPSSVEEAVKRIFEPHKKFCLVEKVWDEKKERWFYMEVEEK